MDRRGFLGRLGLGAAAAGVLGKGAIACLPKEVLDEAVSGKLMIPEATGLTAVVPEAQGLTAKGLETVTLPNSNPWVCDAGVVIPTGNPYDNDRGIHITQDKPLTPPYVVDESAPLRSVSHYADHGHYPGNGFYLTLTQSLKYLPGCTPGSYVIRSINDAKYRVSMESEIQVEGVAMAAFVARHHHTGVFSTDPNSQLFRDLVQMTRKRKIGYQAGCVIWLALRHGPVVAYNLMSLSQNRVIRTFRDGSDIAQPWGLKANQCTVSINSQPRQFYVPAATKIDTQPGTTYETVRERFVAAGMSNPGELR